MKGRQTYCDGWWWGNELQICSSGDGGGGCVMELRGRLHHSFSSCLGGQRRRRKGGESKWAKATVNLGNQKHRLSAFLTAHQPDAALNTDGLPSKRSAWTCVRVNLWGMRRVGGGVTEEERVLQIILANRDMHVNTLKTALRKVSF